MHKSLSTEVDIFVKVFLLKRIRHSHCVVLKGPQVAYAACVSLPNSCDVKQLGRSPIWRLERGAPSTGSGGLYSHRILRQHPFFVFLQKFFSEPKTLYFQTKSHPLSRLTGPSK